MQSCRRKRGGNQRHKSPAEEEEGIGEDPLVTCAEGINREVEEELGEDRGPAARLDMISSIQAWLDGSKRHWSQTPLTRKNTQRNDT